MKALYVNNVILTTTTITPLSENPTYPCSTALQDTRLSRLYRSIGVASENIVFDFASAKACTNIVILGHNFTAGATITIQANSSNSWGSPAYSQALTVADDIAYTFAATKTYRYWRLTMVDASNTAGYLEVAYIFIGGALTLPGVDPMCKIPRYSSADYTRSVSGQLYGNTRIQWRQATVSFPCITNTEKGYIETLFGYVDKVTPFVLMVWENDLDKEPLIYCHLTKDLEWAKTSTNGITWALEMSFEEVK